MQTSVDEPAESGPTWYQHALAYMAYKWPRVAASNRFSITWVIAETTVALLPHHPTRPGDRDLRQALRQWGLIPGKTTGTEPVPDDVKVALAWIEDHSPSCRTWPTSPGCGAYSTSWP
ncbi:hypothetical protein GCM10029992_36000 [Glycomyces albus]